MDDQPLTDKSRVRLLCRAIAADDLQAVREQLAGGCPTTHPELQAPLMLALRQANAGIIDAILDAGAQIPDDDFRVAMKRALEAGNLRVLEHAATNGVITESDFPELMFSAIRCQQEPLALRLLELGASPAATRWDDGGKQVMSVFEAAATWGAFPKLIPAMTARLTQEQKDRLLVDLVRVNGKAAVSALLDSGADANQIVHGRTLLQLARGGSEDLRRALRAAQTAALLDSAMNGDGDTSAPMRPAAQDGPSL